jgi:protein-L-isoaspartate(D-aspartate) O-methyltransferase
VTGWLLNIGTTATWNTDSLTYLALRPADHGRLEIGAITHGPHGEPLARRLLHAVARFDRDHRTGAGPVLRAYPREGTDRPDPSHTAITKRNVLLTVT